MYKNNEPDRIRRVKTFFLIYNGPMFSFLKKKPKEEITSLVTLVTSYGVIGAVVKQFIKPGSVEKPVVLFSCESLTPLSQGIHEGYLRGTLSHTLKQTIRKCRDYMPAYDQLVCSIGEPWVSSMTRVAHLEKREPFVVTKKLIEDLIIRETKLFEQETIRNYTGREEVGILEVSKPLIDANGYRTDQYLHQSVTSLDMHLTFSLAPTLLIEQLAEVFADAFHRTDVVFQSFDLAKMRLLNAYPQGTIFEMGGVTTPITLLDHKEPSSFASIPGGLHSLEQSLVDLFRIPRRDLDAVLSLVGDVDVLEHERKAVSHKISTAYQSLNNQFPIHLARIKKQVERYHQPIVVVGHPRWMMVLESLLRQEMGAPIIIPPQNVLHEDLFFTHQARTVTNPLALAILHATHYEKQ